MGKKERAVIFLSLGLAAIFLGIISFIDIVVYNRAFSWVFPVIVIIIGTYVLYPNLRKLLKK